MVNKTAAVKKVPSGQEISSSSFPLKRPGGNHLLAIIHKYYISIQKEKRKEVSKEGCEVKGNETEGIPNNQEITRAMQANERPEAAVWEQTAQHGRHSGNGTIGSNLRVRDMG